MSIDPSIYRINFIHDLCAKQGATFWYRFTLAHKTAAGDITPFDLTGLTARMMVRRRPRTEKLLELTTDNGMILLGGAQGTVELRIPAPTTATLPALVGVYDLELVEGTDVARPLSGAFTISAEVTR